MSNETKEPEQCSQTVYIRDTYRYTGRTKSGFELHYDERRCSRKAVVGKYCKQHAIVRKNRGQSVEE